MLEIQLMRLLEGLDVPHPEFWMLQPPEALYSLGKAISNQAKQVPTDNIEQLGLTIRVHAAINRNKE